MRELKSSVKISLIGASAAALVTLTLTLGIGKNRGARISPDFPNATSFEPSSEPSARSPASEKRVARSQSNAKAGVSSIYQFERKLAAMVGSAPLFQFAYDGRLEVRFLAETRGERHFVASFLFSDGTLSHFPAGFREKMAARSPLLYFTQSKDADSITYRYENNPIDDSSPKNSVAQGSPTDGSDAAQLHAQKVRILADILSQMNLERSEDLIGKYRATTEDFGPDRSIRTKHEYLTSVSGAAPKVVQSRAEIKWMRGEENPSSHVIGKWREIRAKETLVTGSGSSAVTQESELRIAFLSSKALGADEAERTLLARESSVEFKLSETPNPAGNAVRDTGQARILSWRELNLRLDRLKSDAGPERLKTFHELIRSLEKNPEIAASLKSKLLREGKSLPLLKTGIGALAAAGTEGAQMALREVYLASRGVPSTQQMVLTALTTTDAPASSETREFLKSVAQKTAALQETDSATISRTPAQDLAESATYALGSTLKKETSPAAAADTEKALAELLARSKVQAERGVVLDAIGNSGDANLLPQVKEFLTGADPVLREKAVFSLRFMPPDTVEPLLLSALDDTDPKVRRSAILAVRYQKTSGSDVRRYSEKLRTCAEKEINAEIRSQCSTLVRSSL